MLVGIETREQNCGFLPSQECFRESKEWCSWIPAYAGMLSGKQGMVFMDSCFRRNAFRYPSNHCNI